MKKSTYDYKLRISGLPAGVHHFTYHLNMDFLRTQQGEQSGMLEDLRDAHFSVGVALQAQEGFYTLDFDVQGEITTDCDRCTREVHLPIRATYHLLLKKVHGDPRPYNESEKDCDVQYVHAETYFFDLSQLLYEYCMLSIPFVKTCAASLDYTHCDEVLLARVGLSAEE